jgi:hypothetical protein
VFVRQGNIGNTLPEGQEFVEEVVLRVLWETHMNYRSTVFPLGTVSVGVAIFPLATCVHFGSGEMFGKGET